MLRRQRGRVGRALLAGVLTVCLGTPVAAQPAAVVPELERLVGTTTRGLGKPALQRDPHLDAAAQALLAQYPKTDELPNPAISAALWQQQIVEPIHRLLLVHYGTQSPEAMLSALPTQLRVLVGSGRWHRFGVAVAPAGADDSRALNIVLESFVQTTPPAPAALGEAVQLTGTLRRPYDSPRVMVTAPGGAAETPPLTGTRARFTVPLRCAERGRYQVEVLGEDKGGPTVLANFPWYCGQAPPTTADPALTGVAELPWRDAADAEQQAQTLLNRDRQRAGLPPVPLDAALSAVARAHCQDMAEHQFVAHLSPRSGGPADRVRRAGIAAALVTENLAQARSPKEAQDGLMGSPGHRANILDPRVSRVGIGVREIVGVAGLRQLLLTQVYVGDPVAIDLRDAPNRVVSTLQTQRRAAGRPELGVDAALNTLAQRTAEGVTSGDISESHPDALVDKAQPSLRGRFATVRAALAVAHSPEQIAEVPALIDAAATDIGVAVAARPPRKAGEAPALYIVVMVARRVPPR